MCLNKLFNEKISHGTFTKAGKLLILCDWINKIIWKQGTVSTKSESDLWKVDNC